MSFDTSLLAAWTDEIGDKSDFILKPILAANTLQRLSGIDKRMGIKGHTESIPTFDTTTPWQAGTACGFTSSGATDFNQIDITTKPVKIQESICLQDLETFFTTKLLPASSRPETFQLMDMWVGRKMEQIALQIESSIWQGDTTTTNATHLKQFNGWINLIDAAADEIAATQQASITTTTVRGIIEEIAFNKIPSKIRSLKPVVVCGQDTFNIYLQKLMEDNLFQHDPSNTDLDNYTINIFGTNTKLIGLAGLNNDNAVDTGNLPTVVKNRVFATYQDNLMLGMNAENSVKDFDVWYSKDDQLLKFATRFHLGAQVKFTDLVVSYLNT